MVTPSEWQDMLNVRGLLSFHKENNLNGKFASAIKKEERILREMMDDAVIESNYRH